MFARHDRKQGVRFGVFEVCGLVNFNVFLPNSTPNMNQTAHCASSQANIKLLCL